MMQCECPDIAGCPVAFNTYLSHSGLSSRFVFGRFLWYSCAALVSAKQAASGASLFQNSLKFRKRYSLFIMITSTHLQLLFALQF